MYHVALYNPETKEIVGAEAYPDADKAYERWTMYEVEARGRAWPWQPYKGDKPFSFEPLQPTPEGV